MAFALVEWKFEGFNLSSQLKTKMTDWWLLLPKVLLLMVLAIFITSRGISGPYLHTLPMWGILISSWLDVCALLLQNNMK